MAKRERNEMLKHKIEKFDVRRFMGLLERSKLARCSSFREPLYFSFAGTPRWIFVAVLVAGVFVALTKAFPSLSRSPSRFYSLQYELSLRHLCNDLSRAAASVFQLRFTTFFEF